MENIKNIIQIANRVQDALTKLKHHRYLELMRQLISFSGQFQELTAESRKMGASLANGWLSAAESCCKSVSRLLNDIPYSVSRIKELIETPDKEKPKLSVLVDELNQLQEEFGSLELENAQNTISVITEPITLEDVHLGSFRIQLELNKLSELYQSSPYYVVALNPNPAATDETVTHPHVTNEKLCEGDAALAIRKALEQGRLCDFFTIVRSILNTYSPDSPYVPLHDWDGVSCYECGYVTDSENSYYCSFCDNSFCEECCSCCHICYETICNGCSQLCESCEESTCPNCINECAGCGLLFCNSCLEEELCSTCRQERKAEDERKDREQNTETDRTKSRTQLHTTDPQNELAA